MTREQAKSTGNISIWAEARKDDMVKLIYAYVISPLMVFAAIGGNMAADVYERYGHNATRYSVAISMANKLALRLSLISYLQI